LIAVAENVHGELEDPGAVDTGWDAVWIAVDWADGAEDDRMTGGVADAEDHHMSGYCRVAVL
jgi:hypothetical protein